MNMDQLPDDSDALRRLVALKRHETPPPGYFREFSKQVRRRIDAEAELKNQSGWRSWLRFAGPNPVWRNANAIIGSGLVLLAISAAFLKKPNTTGEASPGQPKAAGLNFGQASAPRANSSEVEEVFRLPAGLGYRIEVITFDSNAPVARLILEPGSPVQRVEWPR